MYCSSWQIFAAGCCALARPHDVMHKRGLMQSRGFRLSVRLSVTFVYSVETSKQTFKIFSLPHSSFFRTERYDNILTETPLMGRGGASNAGEVGKNRAFRQVSRFVVCCQRCDARGGKRRRSVHEKTPQLYAADDRTAFNCTQW